jgi:hypothetical protein
MTGEANDGRRDHERAVTELAERLPEGLQRLLDRFDAMVARSLLPWTKS